MSKASVGEGSYIDPRSGLRRSARIAALTNVVPGVESAATKGISDKEIDDMANDLATKLKIAGGSKKLRRLRGGDGVVEAAKAKAAFAKSVAMMTVYTITDIATIAVQAGYPPARDATTTALDYLTRELTPLGAAGARFVSILAGLANQSFRAGVTLVMLPVATAGFTANFISKVISNFNEWGRGASAELLGDAKAIAAANAAVGSLKQAGVTAGIGLVVANQVGLLPMSALLAAILFSIQVNIGTGVGRGYVVAGFYAWYLGQTPEKRAEINAAARQYAASASSAGASGAAVTAAAAKLAPLLASAATATSEAATAATKAGIAAMTGKNAFQAVAAGAAAANAEVAAPGSPPAATQDIGSAAAANTALTTAVPAAGIAAAKASEELPPAASSSAAVGRRAAVGEDEEDGAAAAAAAPAARVAVGEVPNPKKRGRDEGSAVAEAFKSAVARRARRATPAPGDGDAAMEPKGGRGKTKKGKSKRRVTRRRKAPKYLAAPVFVY